MKPAAASRALLIAGFDPAGLGTVVEYIGAFAAKSRWHTDVLNLRYCPIRAAKFELPVDLELSSYDILIIHPTASYDPDQLFALDSSRKEKIRDFSGVKVMLKQDEHYRTGRVVDYLETARVDILATCLEPSEATRVYPSSRLPGLRLLHVLTGYVSDEMLDLRYPPVSERLIDVGYRGSLQPWHFGRLAYEKQEIGDRFQQAAAPFGLRTDISSRWEDRFFGKDWYDFLGRCKATLGVESGASIFDFTGEVEQRCHRYLQDRPGALFNELFERILAPYHENVRYRAVSPRHFEAAACGTLQILYEGEYQGVFLPWRHYVPLRRDFANFKQVAEVIRDAPRARELTERAFEEIIGNPKYRYSAFVEQLDRAIAEKLEQGRR